MSALEVFPAHVLDMVMENLKVEDVSRLSRSCSSLYTTITSDNRLWRRFCEVTWLCNQLSDSCPTWYSQWLQCCEEFGRYKACYANVKGAWTRIEANLTIRCPAAYEDIMRSAPLTEADIDGLEQRLGVPLPNDYRCSLRIHGSHAITMGTTEWYYFSATYNLLGIDGITNLSVETTEGEKATFVVLAEGWTKINVREIQQYMCEALLLGVDSDDNVVPRAADGSNHVIPRGHVVSGYFRETFIAAGAIRVIRFSHFARAERSFTFEDWLVLEAQNMDNRCVVNQKLTRFLLHPSSIAVTGHFTVKVATTYDPTFGDWQHPGAFHGRPNCDTGYSYHVMIEMSADAPAEEACQLLYRHWEIQEDGEPIRTVDGEGVVGHQPVFHPGDKFEYASYNHFSFPIAYSVMSGNFVMRYLNRPGEFEVRIPHFRMELVPLTEFKQLATF